MFLLKKGGCYLELFDMFTIYCPYFEGERHFKMAVGHVERLEGDMQMRTGQTRKVLIVNVYG
jgi:hypothetical protein